MMKMKEMCDDMVAGNLPDRVVWISNARVEAMIIHVLGPESSMEATRNLQEIGMAKSAAFSYLGTATNYVEEWKDALRWYKSLFIWTIL